MLRCCGEGVTGPRLGRPGGPFRIAPLSYQRSLGLSHPIQPAEPPAERGRSRRPYTGKLS
jgi:hypothetical protein